MTYRNLFHFLSLLALYAAHVADSHSPLNPVEPSSIVIVANGNDPESIQLARTYQQMREIPEDHLVFLETRLKQKIPRREYVDTIHNPLLDKLVEKELINAIPGLPDSLGRNTITVIENRIQYLVLVYGIPTTIGNVPPALLDDLEFRKKWFSGKPAYPGKSFDEGKMARNVASVDTELALLLQRNVPLNGIVPSPFFMNGSPEKVRDLLRVTRIDGPSADAVYRLLENTRLAEENGLRGRAYVDHSGRSGPYQMGSDWMTRAAEIFKNLDFDLEEHPDGPTFPADSRFDAVALYAGWYSPKITGPFTLPGFKLSPGAVAAHLHSFSGAQVRSNVKGWVGPLVDMGACATFGNVDEPYLTFTHFFDLYFRCLAEGWNVVDAAYYALPVLSWQGLTIGDPFYVPFKTSVGEQMDRIRNIDEITRYDQYVVLRQQNALEKKGFINEARVLVEDRMLTYPGPALALEQALLIEKNGKAGKRKRARRMLAEIADRKPANSSEWGLFASIADHLSRLGDAPGALEIYKSLIAEDMPDAARRAFVKRGLMVAKKARDSATIKEWELLLNPPAPEKN